MKTEFEIAKENIDLEVNFVSKCEEGCNYSLRICETHKEACQRWLEFLEQLKIDKTWDVCWIQEDGVNIKDKITDLKNTIKLYSENGI